MKWYAALCAGVFVAPIRTISIWFDGVAARAAKLICTGT
jgi:hypothetical protein